MRFKYVPENSWRVVQGWYKIICQGSNMENEASRSSEERRITSG